MPSRPPKLIPILRDDYHAQHIGTTADGRQFFLTTPFLPASGGTGGCEFIARYVFSRSGDLIDATIDDLGPRGAMDEQMRVDLLHRRLSELGPTTPGDIRVKPFAVERFGVRFGLITVAPEEDGDTWWVKAMPGDFMAFTEPWDGLYDT
ncbi:MAG: hypothetical protein K2Q20_13495 [Phycisphaerales bacterium]|nr:hypothetical protein [Phycisphaerales bacterium]